MIDIRPAIDSDKGQILERMAEVYGSDEAERAERRWDWQWRLDPRLEEPGYRGIVAEWRGRIIGTLSCMPAGLYIAGQPASANWCVDILVHWGLMRQALRGQRRRKADGSPVFSEGIAAAMLDHPAAAGSIQLAKHIADPMMLIGFRIGFVAPPNNANMTRRISLRRPLEGALGKPLGGLVAAGANLAIPIPHPRMAARHFDGPFDARFDALWNDARRGYPAITRRDAATLSWHYRQHPDTSYKVLILENADTLRGYAVVKVFQRRGRLLARIVDLLARNGDAEAKRALMAAAVAYARGEGAERAEYFAAGADLMRISRDLGFTPKLSRAKRPQPLMVRGLPEVELYVTRGDGDGG